MEKTDDDHDFRSQDDQENGSDSKNGAHPDEPDVYSLSSQKPDKENVQEKEKAADQLEKNDSPKESRPGPAEKDLTDQNSNDSQDTIEVDYEQNGAKKVGPGSISLSTLISTIIKGTVASMDDVGKDIGSLTTTAAISPGETVSSSELQDEPLSSAADNQESVTDPVQDTVLQSNGDEVLETTPPPAYNPGVGSYGRGRGRRSRMQHRFALSWKSTYEEASEMPQTETIETDVGKIYQCVSCKVSFNYEQDMRMHLQTHLRPRYFCPVCSRRFLNQSTLERHIVTHDQTKPYVCSICSQGFRIKSNLNRHYQRIHNSKVELGEARRGRPMGSSSRPSLATQEDNLANPNFPISNLGKVPGSITHLYPPQSPYRDFAAPQKKFHPNSHFEQMTDPPEQGTDVVSSTERIADFPQPQPAFEFDQSSSINTEPLDKPDPEENEPNNALLDGRVTAGNLDDDESYAHLFLSRYPDVESAVDAIRRIETERLFHQELLLEELKLRRKYGLPSSSVLEDLKKETAIKEKIGDLDSFITQGDGELGRPQAPTIARPVSDLDHLTESSPRISPNSQCLDASFQMERPVRRDYLLGVLPGHQANNEITPRSISSDLLHHGAQDIMFESQASTQLRRLSALSAPIPPANPLASNAGSLSNFGSASDGPFVSSQLPVESSDEWSASQRLKALTPPFGRPRRGRRRLASMSAGNTLSFPPRFSNELEIPGQRFSLPTRKVRSPPPMSQVVHHRPVLPYGPPQAFPPPALLRPPPLPFRMQHDSSHRFSSVANLPPPPEHVLPSSPRYPAPKRFRPTMQQLTTTELQNLEYLANHQERNYLDIMRPMVGAHPSRPNQATAVSSDHASDTSNPFTMSGPPNRSIKPLAYNGLQTPHTSSGFSSTTQGASPSSNNINDEPEGTSAAPLDLSQKN